MSSHGYVVFGVKHTHTSDPIDFPDGRITTLAPFDPVYDETAIRLEDLKLVLNEIEQLEKNDLTGLFTHRLNLSAIGAMGHSLGAAAVLELGQKDSRVKAVIALDGLFKPLLNPDEQIAPYEKPLMIMYNSQHGTFSKDDTDTPAFDLSAVLSKMKEEVAKVRQNARNDMYEVQWKAHHMTFSDYFMLTSMATDYEQEMNNLKIVKEFIVSFFDKYLKNINLNALLDGKILYNRATTISNVD
ncbi:hypothetical protein H0X48_06925 [Candidatus Dependentiae bacterium]|nr:hypothetical protein [Candidatus Dependentiae bacterium]